MKKTLFIFSFLLSLNSSFSQTNFIYNGGFEDKGTGKNYPTPVPPGDYSYAQSDNLDHWESRTSNKTANIQYEYLHSPDWLHTDGSGTQSNYGHPPAKYGKGLLGITNYELIQQKFKNNEMIGGRAYEVSLDIRIAGGGLLPFANSSVRIFLAKNKLHYKNEPTILPLSQDWEDACTHDYTKYKESSQNYKEIARFDLNPSDFNTNSGWKYFSKGFEAPLDIGAWDYIVIDLIKNDYPSGHEDGNKDDCQDAYVFIDGVSLVSASFCNLVCAPELGEITHGGFFNAVQPTEHESHILVANAVGIDFVVFSSEQQVLYSQFEFDPNGLKDPGFDDYIFHWDGTLANGTFLPEDVYVYKLTMWNCNDVVEHISSYTYIQGDLIDNPTPPPIKNYILNDCCPNELYIQNKTYTEDETEYSNIFIKAGSNVTSGTNGPVIVSAGQTVKYISSEIDLLPGFSVEAGAEFTAIATDICSYSTRGRFAERKTYTDPDISLFNKHRSKLLFYPNPSANGIFQYKLSDIEELQSIEIFSMAGQRLGEIPLKLEGVIDLSAYPTGMYLIKLSYRNEKTSFTKLIKG